MDLNDIPQMVIAMAVAVVVVVVMSLLIASLQSQAPNVVVAHANESATFTNGTVVTLSENGVTNVVVYNESHIFNAGRNYTVNAAAGTVTLLNETADEWWGSKANAVNISYSYPIGSSAYNTTGKGLTAQNTFSSFFPLIALAAIGAIVLGIVIRFFRTKQE